MKGLSRLTACGRHLDWNMRFLQELGLADVSPRIRALADNIVVKYPTEDDDFAAPSICQNLVLSNRVKRVVGKKSWTVGCKGTRYMLELALCREWPLSSDKNTHEWSTGISVHCDDWDEALDQKPGSVKPRDLGQNFSALFAPAETRDGIIDFLSVVEGISVLSETVLPAVDMNKNGLSIGDASGQVDHRILRAKDLFRRITTVETSPEPVPENMAILSAQSGVHPARVSATSTVDLNASDGAHCHGQLVDDLIVFN